MNSLLSVLVCGALVISLAAGQDLNEQYTAPDPVCGATTGPPSCADEQCGLYERCELQIASCDVEPCQPQPVCVPDYCQSVSCVENMAVCQMVLHLDAEPDCSPFPFCQYQPTCVPRALPKPGFCPLAADIDAGATDKCEFDNDCASTLICCAHLDKGSSCVAPVHPDPCLCDSPCDAADAPLNGTCVVREEKAVCAEDTYGEPGEFFCRSKCQCFVNRMGRKVCTTLDETPDCPADTR